MGREDNRSGGEWRIKVLDMKIYFLKRNQLYVFDTFLFGFDK